MTSAGTEGLPGIAVVSHNSLSALRQLFPDQVRVAEQLGVPIAVVDNASGDGSADYLRSLQDASQGLLLSLQPRNLGYAGAANIAFDLLGGRDVLLLNPDVELAGPEQVRELVRHLDEHPAVGVCAPRLTSANGSPQPSARRPASLAAMLGSTRVGGKLAPLRRSYERFLAAAEEPGGAAVEWVIGAAMLIRRAAFEQVGGMDPGFFLYMEDADFCRRCRRAGWEVAYLPQVAMRHGYARASSAAGASALSSAARRRHIASLARYWRKHPGALVGRYARR